MTIHRDTLANGDPAVDVTVPISDASVQDFMAALPEPSEAPKKLTPRNRALIAAAVVVALTGGGWFMHGVKQNQKVTEVVAAKTPAPTYTTSKPVADLPDLYGGGRDVTIAGQTITVRDVAAKPGRVAVLHSDDLLQPGISYRTTTGEIYDVHWFTLDVNKPHPLQRGQKLDWSQFAIHRTYPTGNRSNTNSPEQLKFWAELASGNLQKIDPKDVHSTYLRYFGKEISSDDLKVLAAVEQYTFAGLNSPLVPDHALLRAHILTALAQVEGVTAEATTVKGVPAVRVQYTPTQPVYRPDQHGGTDADDYVTIPTSITFVADTGQVTHINDQLRSNPVYAIDALPAPVAKAIRDQVTVVDTKN